MNKRISLTMQAHTIIQQHLKNGDIAVDATTGNGHDTLFLAEKVGMAGKVFGFDIQQQAIESTQTKLATAGIKNTQLFHSSHDKLDQCIPAEFHEKINAIMFNLGYLPGSDKSIITQTKSSLLAVKQSINLLDSLGIITIAAYPGHSGGDIETDAIKQWSEQLATDKYTVKTIFSSDKDTAPRLYIIQKTTLITS